MADYCLLSASLRADQIVYLSERHLLRHYRAVLVAQVAAHPHRQRAAVFVAEPAPNRPRCPAVAWQ